MNIHPQLFRKPVHRQTDNAFTTSLADVTCLPNTNANLIGRLPRTVFAEELCRSYRDICLGIPRCRWISFHSEWFSGQDFRSINFVFVLASETLIRYSIPCDGLQALYWLTACINKLVSSRNRRKGLLLTLYKLWLNYSITGICRRTLLASLSGFFRCFTIVYESVHVALEQRLGPANDLRRWLAFSQTLWPRNRWLQSHIRLS